MNLKRKFLLREIVGENILVPVGEDSMSFNGLITINKSGKFIWENIEGVNSQEELLQLILDNYDIDRDTAKADMEEFLEILKKADIIE